MAIRRIMACLDGSDNSLRGLKVAAEMAKQTGATLVGVHIVTTYGIFTAVHGPQLHKDKWPEDVAKVMERAERIAAQKGVKFEPVAVAGKSAGYDLTAFAAKPANRIDHIVIGARGMGFPKELFFGSTSTFILHKSKKPVTVVR